MVCDVCDNGSSRSVGEVFWELYTRGEPWILLGDDNDEKTQQKKEKTRNQSKREARCMFQECVLC